MSEQEECGINGCKGKRRVIGKIPRTRIILYGCTNPNCKIVTWKESF